MKQAHPHPDIDLLLETMQSLAMVRNLEEVQRLVRTAARRLGHADGATFVLREGDLCHYVDEDAIEPLWRGKRFPMSICISGWSMRHRQAVAIPDIYADDRIPAPFYRPTFVKSLAMVPIRTRDPIGAIGFYWKDQRETSDYQLRLFAVLADAVSATLEHIGIRRKLNALIAEDARAREEAGDTSGSERLALLCSWTGRIDHNGDWVSIEEYLQNCFGIAVSHGISPEGARALERQLQALPDKPNSSGTHQPGP